MTRRLRRAWPLMAVTAALSLAIPAHAGAPATASVNLGTESWYTFPDCPVAGVCVPSMANSYPAETLHVAVSGGKETARTYLALPADAVPAGATIRSGELSLPLDTTTANNGSLNPQLADLEVCTTTSSIPPVSASTATPPPVNCLSSATAAVEGTPATRLVVNLTPLAGALSQPHTSLVLIAGDISKVNANWHVVFSSNRRTSPPVAAPSLTLTYLASPHAGTTSAPAPSAPSAPPAETSNPGTTSLQPAPPLLGGGVPQVAIPAPTLQATSGPAPVVPVGDGPPTPPLSGAQARVFDYPAVFLVPLILLAGWFGFGRQLTRPVTPG